MNAFLDAVGATPLSQLLQNVRWLIPLIQSTHILGVAARGQATASLTARFLPWVGWGVLVLLVTGLLLMVAEPRRALLNPLFQMKMAALVVVGAMTWVIAARAPDKGGLAKSLAVVSLILWLVIIALGRWIAYGP